MSDSVPTLWRSLTLLMKASFLFNHFASKVQLFGLFLQFQPCSIQAFLLISYCGLQRRCSSNQTLNRAAVVYSKFGFSQVG
jgi:hypothetical protein